jgi:hypothetical protein
MEFFSVFFVLFWNFHNFHVAQFSLLLFHSGKACKPRSSTHGGVGEILAALWPRGGDFRVESALRAVHNMAVGLH